MKRSEPRNIRPFEDSLRIIAKLAAQTNIDQKQWFAIVLHAGLVAIEDVDYKFNMPLKLKIAPVVKTEEPGTGLHLNEPRAGKPHPAPARGKGA